MMKDLKCIACGSKVTTELQNVFDTRFGIENAWDICRCTVCGTRQTTPIPLSDELKKLYETYYIFDDEEETIYPRFRELFFSSKLYHFWLAIDGDISFHEIKGSGRLLDMGYNEAAGLRLLQMFSVKVIFGGAKVINQALGCFSKLDQLVA